MQSHTGYNLVRLANGAFSVYAEAYGEKMHPGLGPESEAELLYVRQLKIPERMRERDGEFVVWDVGLGAVANAIAVLRATREIARPLRLVSFDNTAEPLRFALAHSEQLGYLQGYQEPAKALLDKGHVHFTDGAHEADWQFHLADFPSFVAHELERRTSNRHQMKPEFQCAESEFDAPHAIMFDAFSPAKNPAMWTLPLFTNLFQLLDPARPTNLTTYSRSTLLRVTLLLAGFFVGRGVATGLKEETTVAANSIALLGEPLDRKWLERARRSDSAEPLRDASYVQSRLSEHNWERLAAHPQFN